MKKFDFLQAKKMLSNFIGHFFFYKLYDFSSKWFDILRKTIRFSIWIIIATRNRWEEQSIDHIKYTKISSCWASKLPKVPTIRFWSCHQLENILHQIIENARHELKAFLIKWNEWCDFPFTDCTKANWKTIPSI